MTIYIFGPMTGIEDFNYPLFHLAEQILQDRYPDAAIVNPAKLEDKGVPWEVCLREDIRYLMDCDHACALPGWELSKGANLEHHIAKTLGFGLLKLVPIPNARNDVYMVPLGDGYDHKRWDVVPMTPADDTDVEKLLEENHRLKERVTELEGA